MTKKIHYPQLDTILMVEKNRTKNGLPKKNRIMESTSKENDVPNILPHHRLPGTIR